MTLLVRQFVISAIYLLILSIHHDAVAAASQAQSKSSQLFAQIVDAEWAYRLEANPLLSTWIGEKQYNHLLDAVNEDAQRQRHERWQSILNQLSAINENELTAAEQVNFSIFRRQIQSFISQYRFKSYLIPLNSDTGFHTSLARLPQIMPFINRTDYENYLSRLDGIAQYMDEHRVLMREGIKQGISLPKVVLKGRDKGFSAHVVDHVEESVFYQPFMSEVPPADVAAEEWKQWQQRAKKIIETEVIPAYAELARFFTEEYVPGARTSIAARALPNGEAFYQDQVRYYTTLDISVEEVHQIGLTEVARIRSEMEAIIRELQFDGSFADFLSFLRSDKQFYAPTAEALLKHAAWIAKRADAALPSLFTHLPRQPYGVAPVPDDIAPYYTGGRYVPAPIDGTGAAYYWVNTYQLESRPLYVLPALTLHEAVPGHHLQISLAAEQGEQPAFRRNDYISAYGEGWGLYAEHLGVEMGIYQTPYEHFGRLTYEMWRACRLVVDTGIHWKGWSRDQALAYLRDNTALSLHEVETEIDRYISWPGQALSYKMGELTIKRLRRLAEQKLAASFDVREFHDLILAQGSVPLPLLEQMVKLYIGNKKAAAKTGVTLN